jgi:aspartate kinase
MRPIVCKFGGSSVAEADQVRKVESIVRADPRRRFIVVSAPGKRNKQDQKITDLLYLCHDLAAAGREIAEPFGRIRDRYLELARELKAAGEMRSLVDEVEERIRGGASRDYAASRGEYLSARLIAGYMGARFVDAEGRILITADGRVEEETYPRLAGELAGAGLFVVPGFYGSTREGEVRTFSRGGSDISGSIVARAVGADLYENWTDVSGFLMADPAIVPSARSMRAVTYREMRELAYMGAKVLHEEAIFPILRQEIPINIRNTNAPADPGTMIVAERDAGASPVVGIAGRMGFSRLFVEKLMMDREPELRDRLFALLRGGGWRCGPASAGIDSLSVLLDEQQVQGREETLLGEIRRSLQPDRVELQGGLALIAVVGEGMAHRAGTAARLFGALAEIGVNVRLIDYGSSEITILIGVDHGDFARGIEALYRAFG